MINYRLLNIARVIIEEICQEIGQGFLFLVLDPVLHTSCRITYSTQGDVSSERFTSNSNYA